LLKQPQFSPLKTEEQVVAIYAGVNGYLDGIAVNRIRDFEDGLLRLMRDKHMDIMDSIRTEKQITDAMGVKLKAVVDGFTKSFA
jgi:F-type H+-transporting ATPase subunit alpha